MIKLLTDKESIVDVGKIKPMKDNYVVEDMETRGALKWCQGVLEDKNDFILFRDMIKALGLEEYIQMEQEDRLMVIRCNIDK